ncbi:hypothetical protein ALC56_01688 [Trachymyrmex septentrionalis]|uniref:Uncharacterized protein n=1 Tax=Trachymyrmex septentrionalis TaxID=34720 RepID=A0A195FVC8_9HYME|nr:hypothetical protein ALC56_01688 [Trachymyrmex septentrionalis]
MTKKPKRFLEIRIQEEQDHNDHNFESDNAEDSVREDDSDSEDYVVPNDHVSKPRKWLDYIMFLTTNNTEEDEPSTVKEALNGMYRKK